MRLEPIGARMSCLLQLVPAAASVLFASAPAQSTPQQPPAAIVAVGAVEALWSTDLYAKTSGYVTEVKADLGDKVQKGQVLAVIDVPELDAELATARATLAARQAMATAADAAVRQSESALDVARRQVVGVKAETELAAATLRRQEELFGAKGITSQQLDEVRSRAEAARASLDVAEARIGSADADLAAARANAAVARAQVDVAASEVRRTETLLQYTRIRAPFDGVITRRLVNPDDLVQATAGSRSAPLFTCQQIDTVRVYCDVPEPSAPAIGPGVPAEVRLPGPKGAVFRGTVTRIATAVNAASRTMRAEIDLPNPDIALRPGMYAEVTLTPR